MGYRIVTNGEFQHHGIMGQKWGVITRNVGVNYIPIGGRGSSAKETASRVLKGAASGATAAGKAVSGAGKAVIRGAKAYKAEREAKKLEKQHSAYRSGKYRLSKKDIANMTDQEVNNAILRRQREEQLYNMEHPQIAAGKEFFDKYVANTVMSLGGEYAKKFFSMKLDESVRNYIKNNDRYTDEQKRDMLNKLNIEQISDRLARENYENSVRIANERSQKLKNLGSDMEYQAKLQDEMRKAIDSSSLSPDAKLKLYEQNGLLSGVEKAQNAASAKLNERNAIKSLLNNLSEEDANYLMDQYNLRSGTDKAVRDYESKTKANDAIRSRIRETTTDGSPEQLEAFVKAGVATKRESELYNRKSYSNADRLAIRENIDSSDLPFLAKLQEKVRAGVATPAEEMNVKEYEQYIKQGSIKSTRDYFNPQ